MKRSSDTGRLIATIILMITLALAGVMMAACKGGTEETDEKELFVIGFSQLGSESDWRLANTKSMMDTFTNDKGYELVIQNAKQQQDNQFAAIRSFILEGVDLIIIAPTVEEGWENVLREIHDAGIPVIIIDRSVAVWDTNLFLTNVGSDFLRQGQMAIEWLESQPVNPDTGCLKILHLQGTYGATAQIQRTRALEEGVEAHPEWYIASQLYGDFTEAKGYEVMTEYLSDPENRDIDVIYSENDNMTFGAIQALEEAGITYGDEGQVKIITFDATKKALQLCMDGKISVCVECNPMHGPVVEDLISRYRAGESIPRQIFVDETCFTRDNLTQEIIDGREY